MAEMEVELTTEEIDAVEQELIDQELPVEGVELAGEEIVNEELTAGDEQAPTDDGFVPFNEPNSINMKFSKN